MAMAMRTAATTAFFSPSFSSPDPRRPFVSPRRGSACIRLKHPCIHAMGKLRQRYDNLKERYAVSDVTISVQNVASQLGYGSIDSLNLEDMVLEIVRQIEKLIKAKAMMEAAGKPE